MATSPSSSAQAARERVAEQLKEMRLDAGLSGLELSARCGWHAAKTSRIEHGKAAPNAADIHDWCRACGHDDQAADLVAASRQVDQMYVEWRRQQHGGLRRLQESALPLYERTRVFRVYSSTQVPGLLQTAGYTRALLNAIAEFRGIPNDVEAAVESRRRRADLLRRGDHRFVALLDEGVLRRPVGGREVMAEQIAHLQEAMALPSVALGIIPFSVNWTSMWSMATFHIFDDTTVSLETLSAQITITAPGEIAQYERAFINLGRMALYGSSARALLADAAKGAT
ncbi:helix-turn-helix transcriptional regulator [Streptacidiphilus sp. PB12-B1b]|uniref:helix-turn-helix domain-containing protein n=1 Tax=Streptacidiphilus sp. PB12-B1b TaxID=2705012 RepID=UPI0015FB17B3|nr:helix-turn-helix transcriptional regulator [Streptacidiphilus sp. PB12-B1b]QMU79695.1 helix-turn-helix transcriptional regulator [Streptacidiphilus sp. PB12-B1b]